MPGRRSDFSRASGHRFRGATLQTVVTGVGVQGIIVISGILAARLLGVADRGHLALFWVVVLILSQLTTFGLPSASTYFIAEGRTSATAMVASLRRVAWIQAAVALLAHAAVLSVILRDADSYIQEAGALTLFVCPALVAHQYGLALLQGAQTLVAFNVLRTLPSAGYSAGVVVAYVSGSATLVGVTAIWVVATVLCGLLTLMVSRVLGRRDATASSGAAPSHKETFRFGRRAMLGTFSGFEQLQLDQAVVALVLSNRDLGLYVVALAFANLPRLIAASLGIVAFPAVARAQASGAEIKVMRGYLLLTLGLCGTAVALLAVAAPWLTRVFFGAEFSEAGELARLLLVAALLQALRRVMSDAARGAGYPRLGSVAEVGSWLIFVPAAILLSAAAGLTGFGYAVVIASAVGLVLVSVGFLVARRSRAAAELLARRAVDGLESPL